MIALQNINLGKIQGKIINLKIGDKVNLEKTPEVIDLIKAKILSEEEEPENIPYESDQEKFEKIKGIGPELANLLIEKYKTYEEFKTKATAEDLEALPGISKSGSEEIIKLINKQM